MRRLKQVGLVLVCVLALFSVGCSDDDIADIPIEEALEAGLDETITTTVVPLVVFMGTIGDLLSGPIAPALAGAACPNTSGWCSSGTAVCTPGANGLDFDFDECGVGGEPLTLDGNITAVPGNPVLLTLTNLFINNSPAISGTGSIDIKACDYTVNVQTDDATIAGTVTICDSDQYPTGDTLVIGFSGFLVNISFDGSNIAAATALHDGDPAADCTINLAAEPISSSCDAF